VREEEEGESAWWLLLLDDLDSDLAFEDGDDPVFKLFSHHR
jgi:hypothetical protein